MMTSTFLRARLILTERIFIILRARSLVPDVEHNHKYRYGENKHRAGGCRRKLIGAKRQFIRVRTQHLGHMDRSAAGRHPNQRELLYREDKIQHGQTEDNRSKLRYRNIPERLNAAG